MDLLHFLSFLGVALLLTIMPGPDILFVIAQSISQNKKAGISTALGLCTRLLVHITAVTLGISALIYQSVTAFTIIKYAGVAYLLYMAWQSFREKENSIKLEEHQKLDYTSLYKKGILMNILNPKVSLFFLALLPQFVVKPMGFVPLQMLLLGIIFLVQAFFIFTIVSIFSEKTKQVLVRSSFLSKNLHHVKGSILAIIGIQIAFSSKS
ncbi:LysE family translocator [Bacillaceae bacterium S4-13-56]